MSDETGEMRKIWDSTATLPDYNVGVNQWVGPITREMLKDWGKFVTLGPAPAGLPSGIEAVLVLFLFRRMSETPEGLRLIRDIAIQYLKSVSSIITELSQSSSAHVISCAMNQYVACTIYQRMGLMSPHDALQTRAWLDHQTGEAMLTERAGQSLGALTTLVRSTSVNEARGDVRGKYQKESTAGLATLAKVLSK